MIIIKPKYLLVVAALSLLSPVLAPERAHAAGSKKGICASIFEFFASPFKHKRNKSDQPTTTNEELVASTAIQSENNSALEQPPAKIKPDRNERKSRPKAKDKPKTQAATPNPAIKRLSDAIQKEIDSMQGDLNSYKELIAEVTEKSAGSESDSSPQSSKAVAELTAEFTPLIAKQTLLKNALAKIKDDRRLEHWERARLVEDLGADIQTLVDEYNSAGTASASRTENSGTMQKQPIKKKPSKPYKPKPIVSHQPKLLAGLENTNGKTYPHLSDSVVKDWLSSNLGSSAVSLLIGNQYQQVQPEMESDYLAAAQSIVEAGYYVLYDGESQFASKIDEVVGEYGVALCARPTTLNRLNFSRGVVIANPFLRMEAFNQSEKVIITRDSLTGLGMLVEGYADHILDPTGTWVNGFAKFKSDASSYGLGLYGSSSASTIDVLRLANNLKSTKKPKPIEPFDLIEAAKNVNDRDIPSMFRLANAMVEGIRLLTEVGPSTPGSIAGGAAMFGSSGNPGPFTELTYETAYILGRMGIPLATGGHGGVMRLGNQGAHDAGAHSFGITTSGGGFNLAKEGQYNTSDKYHTRTLGSSGYNSRIPLLLYRRQIIASAPGGGGTMREVAVSFVSMANHNSQQSPLFMFIGKNYYKILYKWLKNESSLPEIFKDSLHLVNKPSQVESIVEDFSEKLSKTRLKMLKDKPQKPRHEKRFTTSPRSGRD